MIPWEQLDTADLPGGGQLRLKRRGAEFSIMLGNNELMNSRLSASEEALAHLACARLPRQKGQHLLIGGLGMGFTLRAALATLGPDARITVAEIVPKVVDWAKGPMAALSAGCLNDPRVRLEIVDVRKLIQDAKARYDAILLDVDNGPEGLTVEANDGLYGAFGLEEAHAALRPRGVLAVWSTAPDRYFTRRLKNAGFKAEEHKVRARQGAGARHVIWTATAMPLG